MNDKTKTEPQPKDPDPIKIEFNGKQMTHQEHLCFHAGALAYLNFVGSRMPDKAREMMSQFFHGFITFTAPEEKPTKEDRIAVDVCSKKVSKDLTELAEKLASNLTVAQRQKIIEKVSPGDIERIAAENKMGKLVGINGEKIS